MLTLTRNIQEGITIETPSGEIIGLRVLGVIGTNVKLGFEADRSITIIREELKRQGNGNHGRYSRS